MKKLYYKYATMFAGKSSELIKTYGIYKAQGKNPKVIKPALDTRDKTIKSRIQNVELTADILFTEDTDLYDWIAMEEKENGKVDVLLIDEAQFLTKYHVEQLMLVRYRCPIVCFGLKTDFNGGLFEGSSALLSFADKIEEIKGICECCNSKSTMNLRTILRDNQEIVVTEGDQIVIGDSDQYHALCYYHWDVYRSIGVFPKK